MDKNKAGSVQTISSEGLRVSLKSVRVVGGILEEQGRILLARRAPGRSMAGLWEFPGGKVMPQESDADALARELREELALEVQVGAHIQTVLHRYADFQIELVCYACARVRGEPVLIDHDALAWVTPAELVQYTLTPADVPVAETLAQRPLSP